MVVEQQQRTILAKLALHQSRRCQSIPTLSVLVGGAVAAQQLWSQWLNGANRRTVTYAYESRLSLFMSWLSIVLKEYNLYSLILEKVAMLTDKPSDRLAAWLDNASEYQTTLFWQRLSHTSTEILFLRWLLDQKAQPTLLTTPKADSLVSGLKEDNLPAIAQSFTTVEQLLPHHAAPGILVRLPDAENELSSSEVTLTRLTQLVEAIPTIPLGLLLTPAQAEHLLKQSPESRAKAILRGGMIEVASPDSDTLKQWLCDRGVEANTHQQAIIHLAEQYGATPELLETARSLTESASKPDTSKADEVYRSQAEWLLFQCLEAKPSTAGQFQVNAQLDICFGDRPMEVDFLAADAKIVIEIDGYYHFRSKDNYRRDRRKDFELQRQGFMVLRFLAEDVVARLEEILDMIGQALALRKTQQSIFWRHNALIATHCST